MSGFSIVSMMAPLNGATKQSCEELEDTVDGVFVLCMSFSSFDGFLPQGGVGLFESAELRGYSLLLATNGIDAFDY